MSIKYIHREHLDEEKYNQCIDTSIHSKIYAFSWYLDIVCEQWGVLVLHDYDAVMPVPWRKKYGIKYVYPPFWVLQLGVYTKETIDENKFLTHLFCTWIKLNYRVYLILISDIVLIVKTQDITQNYYGYSFLTQQI